MIALVLGQCTKELFWLWSLHLKTGKTFTYLADGIGSEINEGLLKEVLAQFNCRVSSEFE